MESLPSRPPVSTIIQARAQIAQPTTRPKDCVRNLSSDGMTNSQITEALIDGKIGQTHLGVLELIMDQPLKRIDREDGGVMLAFNPYLIKKALGLHSNKRLRELIHDLIKTTISIKWSRNGNDYATEGSIVSRRLEAKEHVEIDGIKEKYVRWAIELNPAYVYLLLQDLPLYYDPLLPISMQAGISQAVLRYLFGQKNQPNGGWLITRLLEKVGADLNNRHHKKTLLKDQAVFQKSGFTIEGDRIIKSATEQD